MYENEPTGPQPETASQESKDAINVNLEGVQAEFEGFSKSRNEALSDMFRRSSVSIGDLVILRMLNPDTSLPQRAVENIKQFASERLDSTLHSDDRSTMEAARHASNILLMGEQPKLSPDDYDFINTGHSNIVGMDYQSYRKITPEGATFSADLAILGKRPVLNPDQMRALQARTYEAQGDARSGSKSWYEFTTFAASQRILGETIKLSSDDWAGILQETKLLSTKAGIIGNGNRLETKKYVAFMRNVAILAFHKVETLQGGGLAINGRKLAPEGSKT